MTTNKDFKRLVRGRMQKTGESYSTARLHLVAGPASSRRAATRAAPTSLPPAVDLAKIAGMSDRSVEKATGCGWEKWVQTLDKLEAHTWPHAKIAQVVHETFQVPWWWTQTVTVGFTWSDQTSVELWFTAKGTGKSSVGVQHVNLPDKETAERLKAYWSERLDALAGLLVPKASKPWLRPKT